MDRSKKYASNRKRFWRQGGYVVKVREERKMKRAPTHRESNEVYHSLRENLGRIRFGVK